MVEDSTNMSHNLMMKNRSKDNNFIIKITQSHTLFTSTTLGAIQGFHTKPPPL